MRLLPADCLLVVPPLSHLTWPCLGVHQLQACAREAGFEVRVLYANLLFARRIGPVRYAALCNAPTEWLLGERLFCRAAWGSPPLGTDAASFLEAVRAEPEGSGPALERYLDHLSDATGEIWYGEPPQVEASWLPELADEADAFAIEVGQAIAAADYPIVGVTTSFDQTSAASALIRALKRQKPGTLTLIGGANCDGPMSQGIASLPEHPFDHVFRGESEATFVGLLERWRAGEPLGPAILQGAPNPHLEALPTPDPSDWIEQIAEVELGDAPLWLSYETSRGCWWGQKHHCTFCGLNAEGMGFREKSADKVLADLRALIERTGLRRIALTDNIMPHRYHRTLIPRMPSELPDLHLFYEQKANLDLDQVEALWDAGNRVIQPGIEALSTDLLKAMNKGVKARQNVALLRYARSVGMGVKWNLLHALPGDKVAWYTETLELLPLLEHLNPPHALVHLSLDRFSPYLDDPDRYGIVDLRPLAAYAAVFPPGTRLDDLAYHFDASWQTDSHAHPSVMAALHLAVERWRASWRGERPLLHLTRQGSGYLLTDTRTCRRGETWLLNEAQAHTVLHGCDLDAPLAGWALRNGFTARLDQRCVPLATAAPALFRALTTPPEGPVAVTTLGLLA